jgi:RNA polymerase sigma-70 factor, ECF subfamily
MSVQPYTDTEFGRLVIDALPRVLAFCRKLTGNVTEADDLVQDVVLKALGHRAQFAPGSNLTAWLQTIARNHWFTACRKRWREMPLLDGVVERIPQRADQLERIIAREGIDRVVQVLPDFAKPSVFAIAEGASYDEASEALGLPAGTVKSRVCRGRAMLAEAGL